MKVIETFLHLDPKKWTREEIEEECGELLRQRMEAMLDLRDLILNSDQYKKASRINEIFSIKMIQMSEQERKAEFENAVKEITKRDFEEIAKSITDEDKHIELLKGYKGYKNEWKLYTRTNVDSFKYYYQKAKFILRCYYDDYQYCINLQFKGYEKLLEPYMKQHYELMRNRKKTNKMTQAEFEFRLENVGLLQNTWIDPELSQYSTLIHMFSYSGLSDEQLASMFEPDRGSIENDVKKQYTTLAHVLEMMDKNYITGKEFLEQRNLAEEKVEKAERGQEISLTTAEKTCKPLSIKIKDYFDVITTRKPYAKATINSYRKSLCATLSSAKR